MNLVKSFLANIFVWPGMCIQALGALIVKIGYELHIHLGTEFGVKLVAAKEAMKKVKDHMAQLEKTLQNKGNQDFIQKVKAKEDRRLVDIVKGDSSDT